MPHNYVMNEDFFDLLHHDLSQIQPTDLENKIKLLTYQCHNIFSIQIREQYYNKFKKINWNLYVQQNYVQFESFESNKIELRVPVSIQS